MDLQQIVRQSVDRLIASETIERAIQEQLEKTVVAVVKDQLGTYGEFGKTLQAAVKQSLQLHGDLDLPSYNDCILRIVRAQLEGRTQAVIQQQLADQLGELLTPAPESINLSELVEQFVDRVRKGLDGCVCHGERQRITLHVIDEVYEWSTAFWRVCLDERDGRAAGECDIVLHCTGDKINRLHFRRSDVSERTIFAQPLYGFELSLFQMRAAGTRIIRDCPPNEIETSYAGDD